MSKNKKSKVPKIDPRTLLRPRLDTLLDRRALGEVDAGALQSGLQALLRDGGSNALFGALLKRLAAAAPAEREAVLAALPALRTDDAVKYLWQQSRDAGREFEERRAGLALLRAMGEDADPDELLPSAQPQPAPPVQPQPAPPTQLQPAPSMPKAGLPPGMRDELTRLRAELAGMPEGEAVKMLAELIAGEIGVGHAGDGRWAAFEAADLAGKIDLYETALAAPEIDAEDAWEMLLEIRTALRPAASPAGRTQYAALVDRLRERDPQAYSAHRVHYLQDAVEDAITEERWDAVPALLAEFVPDIVRGADAFNELADALMYHGQLRTLVDAMRAAWPAYTASADLVPWAAGEFSETLLLLLFYDYMETAPAPSVDDPVFWEATAPYGEFLRSWFERTTRHLTTAAHWTPADFGPAVDADQWTENLAGLFFEFMAEQRRAGVPLTRSELAREPLADLLHRQAVVMPARALKGKSKGKAARPEPPLPSAAALLVPRYEAADRIWTHYLQFPSARPYVLLAAVGSLPAYLHFIARRGLLARAGLAAALAELKPLVAVAVSAVQGLTADPHAVAALEAAWAEDRLAEVIRDPHVPDEVAAPPPAIVPAPARPGALLAFTFKVTYQREPEIWRTIEVLAGHSLLDLHRAIQVAFEFDDDHMYSFYMSGTAWDKDTEFAGAPQHGERGAASARVDTLAWRPRQRFLYLFDYGDEHRFTVQLVGFDPEAPQARYPRIIEEHGDAPQQYPVWDEEAEWDDEDDEDPEDAEDIDDWDVDDVDDADGA